MIEFAILLHLKRASEHKVMYHIMSSEKNRSLKTNSTTLSYMKDGNNISESLSDLDKSVALMDKTLELERRTFLHNSHKIDYIALFVFVLMFSMFNCAYWAYYLLF